MSVREEGHPLIHLEGFKDLTIAQPGFDYYLNRVRRLETFAFTKRAHGGWDRLIDLTEVVPEMAALVAQALAEMQTGDTNNTLACTRRALLERLGALTESEVEALESKRFYKMFWREGFTHELMNDLQNPHAAPEFIEASAFRGYPDSEIAALHPVSELADVYRVFCSSGRLMHDALVWKEAAIAGRFGELLEAITDQQVVLMGPPHFKDLGQRLGLGDYHHVTIHPFKAIQNREETLKRMRLVLDQTFDSDKPRFALFQAGSLAHWTIYRLFPSSPRTFFLDLGRALDVWYPDVVGSQPWFRANRAKIIERMGLESFHS